MIVSDGRRSRPFFYSSGKQAGLIPGRRKASVRGAAPLALLRAGAGHGFAVRLCSPTPVSERECKTSARLFDAPLFFNSQLTTTEESHESQHDGLSDRNPQTES